MRSFLLARWLRSLLRPRIKTFVKKPGRRLVLEELEERVTPTSTFIWSGQATDDNWSSPTNWQGNIAPTGTGDDLVFQVGAAQLNSNNDLTGAAINSISFSSSN